MSAMNGLQAVTGRSTAGVLQDSGMRPSSGPLGPPVFCLFHQCLARVYCTLNILGGMYKRIVLEAWGCLEFGKVKHEGT